MRILIATMQLDIGGAETHIVELAKALSRRGIEVIAASNGGAYVPELEEAVFKDNEQAAVLYQEVAEQQQIPKIPVYVSKKTERKLGKKQKLVTDSGIELLVPLELLKDESILEYHQNDDGKMSILIKEIGFIENK